MWRSVISSDLPLGGWNSSRSRIDARAIFSRYLLQELGPLLYQRDPGTKYAMDDATQMRHWSCAQLTRERPTLDDYWIRAGRRTYWKVSRVCWEDFSKSIPAENPLSPMSQANASKGARETSPSTPYAVCGMRRELVTVSY